MISELIIDATLFKNFIELALNSHVTSVVKHMAYTSLKTHAENMIVGHMLKIISWIFIISYNQMLRIVVIKLSSFSVIVICSFAVMEY